MRSLKFSTTTTIYLLLHLFTSYPAYGIDEHVLFTNIRCPVCASQSLSESQAPESIQLREEIRKMIQTGRSTGDIQKELVAIYGPEILRTPIFDWSNSLLWITPYIILTGLLLMIVTKTTA